MTTNHNAQTTPKPRAEGEAAIRQQIDSLIAALHAKDLDTLGTIYAADVVSFDVEPPLQHVGLAAKLKNWVTAFTMFAELSYELRDLALVVGDDVAFAYGFGRISGTLDNGAAANGMWVRATFCLQKLDDRWQITHDQASVPLDLRQRQGSHRPRAVSRHAGSGALQCQSAIVARMRWGADDKRLSAPQ